MPRLWPTLPRPHERRRTPRMNCPPNDLYALRAASHAVASPCVAVCKMNPANDFCDGCLRTIDEIAAWSTLGNEGKRVIWQRIEQRRAALSAKTMASISSDPLSKQNHRALS